MTTRQYIGARYVPVFADPVEWDNTRTYEHLMMVQHNGETYISQQAVPIGISLPDTEHGEESNAYWVHMSNWNAQVESYREEVLLYNGRISTLEDDLPISAFDDENTIDKRFDDLEALLPSTAFDTTNTVDKRFDDLEALLPATAFDTTNTVDKRLDDLETKTAKTKMIVIGDSFSDPTDASAVDRMWFDYVGKAQNLTVRNYAKGGTGFVVGSPHTVYQQIQEASTNENANEIAKIYIFSGINDVHNTSVTPSSFLTAVNDALAFACQEFPYSEIVVIGVCPTRNADAQGNNSSEWSVHRYDIFTEYLAVGCAGNYYTNPVKCIKLRNFSYFVDQFFQSTTNWHPSLIGHMALANKILGGLPAIDLSNISGNLSLTHKPVIVDKAGTSHTPDDIKISICGNNTVSISLLWNSTGTFSNSGSTTPHLDLKGFPSGDVFLNIIATSNNYSGVLYEKDSDKLACSRYEFGGSSYENMLSKTVAIVYNVQV